MTTLSAKESMLCWNPGTNQVKLVPYPDLHRANKGYSHTGLACYTAFRDMSFEQVKTMCFIEAVHLIVRDKCDPEAVHAAMLGVTEYEAGLSDDVPGVKHPRDEVEHYGATTSEVL